MRKLHSCNIRAFGAKKVRYLASGQRSDLYGSFGLESGGRGEGEMGRRKGEGGISPFRFPTSRFPISDFPLPISPLSPKKVAQALCK